MALPYVVVCVNGTAVRQALGATISAFLQYHLSEPDSAARGQVRGAGPW